jgi:hypothetical protein
MVRGSSGEGRGTAARRLSDLSSAGFRGGEPFVEHGCRTLIAGSSSGPLLPADPLAGVPGVLPSSQHQTSRLRARSTADAQPSPRVRGGVADRDHRIQRRHLRRDGVEVA